MIGALLVLMAKSFIGPQAVACTSQSAGGKSNSGHPAAPPERPAGGKRAGAWRGAGHSAALGRSGRMAAEMM
jgi:hypothetical protein